MKPFLALEASAGSGKTFALSVRFIAILLSGADAREITALTFTKKAANEMKERIVQTFLQLEEKGAELAELEQILGAGRDEILAMRDARATHFLESDLKIGTFDSFFVGILRSFCLNLGLSADFEVSENLNELQRSEFVASVSKDMRLLKALANLIATAERSQSSFFESLEMFYENFGELKSSENAAFPNESGVAEALKNMREYVLARGGGKDAQSAVKQGSPSEILARSFMSRASLDYRTFSKIYTPELDEMFFELKARLKRYFDALEEYKIAELARFLKIYKECKISLNKRLNSLAFSDVTRLVYELLRGGETDAQMLYFRLDGRINHLLIDEFQDTNVAQYEIMRPLIEEIVAGYGQNGLGSFFYVGDVKQSIYRFRGGKKELFGKLMRDFPQVKAQNLEVNYRSKKALVRFTNAVFAGKIENFKPQRTPEKEGERVNLVGEMPYFEAQEDDLGFVRVSSGDDVAVEAAQQVKFLLEKGVREDDITVLCWKNDDINKISNLLSEVGVKSVSEGVMPLLASKNARAVVEYAKFCLFGERIYKVNTEAILDVNAVKLSVNPQKSALESLHYLASRLGVDMSDADVLRLLELAQPYSNLTEFIYNLDRFEAKASAKSGEGVKIMTVHKSKGLEFENVIVCDKMGAGRQGGPNFIAEYDADAGFWQVRHNVKKQCIDKEFARLKEKAAWLEREEDMNKLYVALTRAIGGLIIVKKTGANGRNPSFFGAYESSGEVIEYLDLIDFSFGEPTPSKARNLTSAGKFEPIELAQISKQIIDETPKTEGKNQKAIYFGLALHYLLEMAEKFDESSLKTAQISMRNAFHKFLDEGELNEIYARGLNLINEPKFKQMTQGKRMFKEQPLRYGGALKQLDLLCVGESEICVIDYKTSDKNIDENIAQVAEYKKILAQIYPNLSVKAAIFYALRDEIRSIDI